MAKLKGGDGTIIIDSIAANNDMQKIKSAANLLHEARNIIKAAGIDDSLFAGDAHIEFESQMHKLDRALSDSEWEASVLAGDHPPRVGIRQIVEAYERADQRIKNMAMGGTA